MENGFRITWKLGGQIKKDSKLMLSAIFLIPVRHNRTRKLHRHATFKEFEKGLLIQFGGWTYHGIVYGCWRDDETKAIIYDRSRKYEICCLTQDLYRLEKCLKRCKPIFGQEAIYLTIVGKAKLV
jgi:hypothetical protein